MSGRSVSSLWRSFVGGLDREEQGYPPTVAATSSQTAADGEEAPGVRSRPMTIALTQESWLIPQSDKLLVFRALTGIDTVPTLVAVGHGVRTAPNVGIYARVVLAERQAIQRHRLFSVAMNLCLGIQIIVAATLTAIGAANGPHTAVTAFGAINTIVAGTLTYLKGSGLPDKLKAQSIEWRNIREYIEQREREFCLATCQLDVQREVHIIETMYSRAKSELEGNGSSDNRAHMTEGRDRRFFAHTFGHHSTQPEPRRASEDTAGEKRPVPYAAAEKRNIADTTTDRRASPEMPSDRPYAAYNPHSDRRQSEMSGDKLHYVTEARED